VGSFVPPQRQYYLKTQPWLICKRDCLLSESPARHRAISKLARKTNHVERFNCTLRQRVSRLVRATLSFSKKLSNHIGAIRYFICDYNLTRCAALPE
jgi:hypothetical protein